MHRSIGWAPRFEHVPTLYPVRPGNASPIGAALSPLASEDKAMSSYGVAVNQHLWTWATLHVAEMLDGDGRAGRPPVLKPEFAHMNVLVPPDAARSALIRAAIRPQLRHRHFASLRSSQALTQSVFGAISAAGCLDLLAGVTAECGRPAFFTDEDHWTLEFEHNVATLGEPRPTSIDVMLSGPDRCVTVECKFDGSRVWNVFPSAPAAVRPGLVRWHLSGPGGAAQPLRVGGDRRLVLGPFARPLRMAARSRPLALPVLASLSTGSQRTRGGSRAWRSH